MAAVQNLGNRVADSASRVGTTGDWSVQAERVRRMIYEDWLRDKVVYGTRRPWSTDSNSCARSST